MFENNIGKKFFKLMNRSFPKHNKMSKTFNPIQDVSFRGCSWVRRSKKVLSLKFLGLIPK